jgi:uncharacterized C2H2 Zn-finger protein
MFLAITYNKGRFSVKSLSRATGFQKTGDRTIRVFALEIFRAGEISIRKSHSDRGRGLIMDGMWYKRCPRCGNYIKKRDPQESGVCCACGWEEYINSIYCEATRNYCTLLSAEGAATISSQTRPEVNSDFSRTVR